MPPPAPGAPAAVAAAPVGYLGLLRHREYVGLLLSRVISLVGDQLARVALTVLVFERTRSALLSALTYAATYLPVVLGGPLLGGLADRVPRRRLLVGADLLRAGLFALMAVPGVPLWALLLLVLTASAVEAPWAAARAPLMRDVLVDDAGYQRGSGLDETLDQTGQVLGFVAAGGLLLLVSPGAALLLDAATFAVSALVVRLLLDEHPPADDEGGRALQGLRDVRAGLAAALAPAARLPLVLSWAGLGLAIVPEALAVPWARELGGGAGAAGLLLAANPLGSVVGLLLVARLPVAVGRRLLVPLTLLTLLPLAAALASPSLPVALLLVTLSGTASSYSLLARVAFVEAVDRALRGRAFAVAAAGIATAQGLGIALAGGLAAVLAPSRAVGWCAVAGLLTVTLVLLLDRAGRAQLWRNPDESGAPEG